MLARCGGYMQQTGMLRPGIRVGIAISGGADSFVLAKLLLERRRVLPFPIELTLLHVNPGFDETSHRVLVDWAKGNGLSGWFETSDHGLKAHSDYNRKRSACFLCSRLRRLRLFALVKRLRLDAIAFGHNLDDAASTFFMNLVQGGRVSGLLPRQRFYGGAFELIRPMLPLEKADVVKLARIWDLPVYKNACPSAGSTNRDRILHRAAGLWDGDERRRAAVFAAVLKHSTEEAAAELNQLHENNDDV